MTNHKTIRIPRYRMPRAIDLQRKQYTLTEIARIMVIPRANVVRSLYTDMVAK